MVQLSNSSTECVDAFDIFTAIQLLREAKGLSFDAQCKMLVQEAFAPLYAAKLVSAVKALSEQTGAIK